jgi:hypothetical protein
LEWRGCPGSACATSNPTSARLTATRKQNCIILSVCCRHGRFEMSTDRSLYKRGNRLTTMIEIGCPPSFISVPCTSSLPPCTPRPPTAAMLPAAPLLRFPRPLPRHRVVAVNFQARSLSRVRSQCPTPLLRPFLSPTAAASIALLLRLSISMSR